VVEGGACLYLHPIVPSPKPNVTTGDVNVLNGAELMTENGSLRFMVGLKALASGYDANGNMILRLKDGARYFLAYDAESRLTSVGGAVSASFAYNGDGQRVTTTYIGGYFEWQYGAGKSYYFAGAQRLAMRAGARVKFLVGDHLGSTAVTTSASGGFETETRYYPWGEARWSSGSSPTDYQFTGQQKVASIGLYFYNSRFYDAALGRFVQADTIIPNPGDPPSFDRFAYVRNNPVRYTDPSGHGACDGLYKVPECKEIDPDGDGKVPRYVPTPVDESQLSDGFGTTGISGKDFYQWYLDRFAETSGWWWEMFGQDSDGFTVWDAIALIMIQEAWMNWSDSNLPEAIIRAANYWCNTRGDCTIEGYINWFAAYSSSAGTFVASGTAPQDPRGWVDSFDIAAEVAMQNIAAIFQEHPPSWNGGCYYYQNRPCGWANSSLYPMDVRVHLQTNQAALFTYNPNYLAGNPWVIPSGCVYYHWLDENHRDLSFICDPVR
jgi:RHS repeat-associated protein